MDDTDKWLGKAVKTLQDSESLYHGLFESLDEAIQISELIFNDDGKPVDVLMLNVNPAYEKQTGLKKDEVIGKTIKNVLSVVEQIWLDRYAEVVREGKSMHFEEYNEGLDRWFDVHASPLKGNRFAAVFTDITERKKAEERYREFFTNPIVGFGLCKVVTNEKGEPIDYIYLEINDAFEEFTGLKREEIINKGVKEVLPEDADNLVSIFGPVGLTGKRIEVEVPIPTLGRVYDVSTYSPSKYHFIAIFTDITERKKAEEELKKSEARFRSVLDNSLDAIYRVNLNTGRYEYFSPAFEHIVGRPAEEYMSQTPEQAMSLIHPDDLSLAKEALSRLDKTDNVKAEYRVRDNSGNYRYLSNHITLVMDKSGQPLYRDGTIRNITKQKKAEEGLRENEEKLRTLFETMPVGISILDKDRNVIYENHALENILELTKEDLLKGKYAKRKYIDSDMTEISLDELPSAKAFYEKKPVENVEVGVIKENNSIIWTNVSAIPLSFSDWKVLVVTSNITERKKGEQESDRLISELDEQRNLLDTIIEQLPVGVGIAEAPSGELIRINEQTRRIWMYDQMEADDMAGYGKYAGFHPDGQKYRSEDWQLVRALKGEVIQGEELEFIRGDETRRFMRSNAAPVKDKAGNIKAAIVVIEDITEHKKAEEELIESKNKLESVIESITDAVFVSDVDGNFVNFNEAFATYHKFKDKEEAYKTLSEYPDYIDVYFADGTLAPLDMWAVPRALRGEIAFNEVYRLRRKDTGEEWWGSYSFAPIKDKDNKIIGSVVVGRDITEQKQIEKELRKAHDNLEEQVEMRTTELEEAYQSLKESELKAKERADLLDVTHEAIFVRDMNDKITFWNKGAEELYGWTKKEALGKVTHDLLRTEFSEPLEQIKIDVLSKGRWDGELIQERIDRTKINILSRWSLQRDKKNKPIGFLELNTDITDLKQTEEQLKEIIGELERSNKELQSFAYITSHDLQEPLRSIGNYAGLLKHRYSGKLDSDADDFLDYMASGAARMKDMVQGLLDYSRVGTQGGEFKEFNAEEALDTSLTNLKSSIEECHAEVTHESLPVIFADESQITRVFQNLIGNALKFHKEGVTPKIHVSAVKTDNEYIFSVQDNGMGIEKQYTDRIFEVFKRLHPIGEYQGAGIGLAIVKRIIERHSGRIWVESDFGVGSTFYFTIPIMNK